MWRNFRTGVVSAVAGASMLGAAGGAVLLSGGGPGGAAPATFLSTPAATSAPTPPTAGTPATPSAATPAAVGCDPARDDGGWPLFTDGRPAGLDAGDAAADYVWHEDATGWHLRITHQNDRHQAWTGVLTTTGTFSDVTAVKLEKNDSFSVGPDRHTITFRFNNYGGVDGLDFHTHCAEAIRFGLRADGAPVNPTEVMIGHGDTNPPAVPFTVHRKG